MTVTAERELSRAVVTGRRSESSPYDPDLAAHDTGDTCDQAAATGFIDIRGPSSKSAAGRDLAQAVA